MTRYKKVIFSEKTYQTKNAGNKREKVMRRKMGSTAVKRAIIGAMVAMLTISQPMMTYAS